MRIMKILNKETNIPFIVRLVEKGDNYGRDLCLTQKTEETTIHFYDARYPHTQLAKDVSGQFTGGSYYVGTLLQDEDKLSKHGLCLHGGVDSWNVDSNTMKQVFEFIKEEANNTIPIC